MALAENDVATLREISDWFFKVDGIYSRTVKHYATLYRYDWYITTELYGNEVNQKKILKDFSKILRILDNTYISKVCAEMALGVIKNGAFYAYLVETKNGFMIQELPINFCRSRYNQNGMPTVEFNMKFFDIAFRDTAYRMKVLSLFPEEFKKGYALYKQNKLEPQTVYDKDSGWYLLDPKHATKFTLSGGVAGSRDMPMFISAVPSLLDLDAAQDLDRRKQMQKLLKILIQKLPRDKNGDLIFDNEEARDIHNNAVKMLKNAVGVDVLTTFADIDSIDMSDKNTTATQDDLEKVEREVFNALGVSQNIFNTEGNMALEKSILDDEGIVRSLLLQFEMFFDSVVRNFFSTSDKYGFRLYMLETTQYNYKDLAKMYKEQVQIGYSKILPQIALGHSQSSILNAAHFENEILHLSDIMIPPLMSSTLTMQDLQGRRGQTQQGNTQQSIEGEKEAGRPEKPDDQKSEKTIQNKESMS